MQPTHGHKKHASSDAKCQESWGSLDIRELEASTPSRTLLLSSGERPGRERGGAGRKTKAMSGNRLREVEATKRLPACASINEGVQDSVLQALHCACCAGWSLAPASVFGPGTFFGFHQVLCTLNLFHQSLCLLTRSWRRSSIYLVVRGCHCDV